MNSIGFFIILISFHAILYALDRLFKSCMQYPYDDFRRNTGLTIAFMRLRWHSSNRASNRTLMHVGHSSSLCRSIFLKNYTIGVVIALILMLIATSILFLSVFGFHSVSGNASSKTNSQIELAILLPGINLPLNEIGYYIITLLLVTVLHELGHAIAAVIEDVPITGFGFQLYFCLPLAYTEISADHLNGLKSLRKLRILCAGIWHNLLYSAICYSLLISVAALAAPLYNINENVIVIDISKQSPLRVDNMMGGSKVMAGKWGLRKENIITHINDCVVLNMDSWYSCLVRSLTHKIGYCISPDFIRFNDESIQIPYFASAGILECCAPHHQHLYCFEYVDAVNSDTVAEIPQHVCLDLRKALANSYGYCAVESSDNGICQKGFCLKPLLVNNTAIMNFQRLDWNKTNLQNVIYIGHPSDVIRSVRVSAFVPKYYYISSKWGDIFILLLKYNIVFSLGVAILNSIPCLGFDGQHIADTLIQSPLLQQLFRNKSQRDVLSITVTTVGSLLFALTTIKILLQNFF